MVLWWASYTFSNTARMEDSQNVMGVIHTGREILTEENMQQFYISTPCKAVYYYCCYQHFCKWWVGMLCLL